MNLTQLAFCPICKSRDFAYFLSCQDYTVSKKTFDLQKCSSCGFVLTNPRPADVELGEYYRSEDYISHSNTRKGFVSAVYQRVRKHTLKKKLNLLTTLKTPAGKLLDIGCGTGEFLNICQQNGWRCEGVEPDPDAREMGRKNFGLTVNEEAKLNEYPGGLFDIVTMWHVLEHVSQLDDRISQVKKLLKPGGVFIVAVPNRDSYDARFYKECWAAYDVPRHLWHFRPADITTLMNNNGLAVKQVLPMRFDSYYISMLSEKYMHGRQRILAALWRGLLSNMKAGKEQWSSQIYIITLK